MTTLPRASPMPLVIPVPRNDTILHARSVSPADTVMPPVSTGVPGDHHMNNSVTLTRKFDQAARLRYFKILLKTRSGQR